MIDSIYSINYSKVIDTASVLGCTPWVAVGWERGRTRPTLCFHTSV